MLKAAIACATLIACGPGTSAKPKPPEPPKQQIDLLAYLPATATAAMGLDVAHLRKTALWAKYKPRLETAFGPLVAGMKAKCGFDPIESVTTITGAMTKDLDDGVLVVRGLDKEKTTACVMKQAVPLTTAVADGDVIVLHHQSGRVYTFAFVDAQTVVARVSTAPNKDGVKAAIATASPLRSSTDFMADFGKVSSAATVWLVMTTKAKWMEQLQGDIGERPLGFDMDVDVTDTVKARSRFRLGKPEPAKKLEDAWKKWFEQAAAFVTGEVKLEANDVVVTGSLKPETIDLLLTSLGFGGAPQDKPPIEPKKNEPKKDDPPNPCD